MYISVAQLKVGGVVHVRNEIRLECSDLLYSRQLPLDILFFSITTTASIKYGHCKLHVTSMCGRGTQFTACHRLWNSQLAFGLGTGGLD
jgi:hypothetical protein